jgi:hypothetical protein
MANLEFDAIGRANLKLQPAVGEVVREMGKECALAAGTF